VKIANSKAVYKKLMKAYGNSFQSILDHHSLKTFDEELYTKDAVAIRIEEQELLDCQADSLAKEDVVLAGSFLKTIDSDEEYVKERMIFFSDGYVEAENYPLSSQKMQNTIEAIAEKVARGIINSKGM